MIVHVDETAYELEPAADAGVTLGEGRRWFGTRVRYRPTAETLGGGTGRWRSYLLVDVHPMDEEKIRESFPAALSAVTSKGSL